MFGAVVGVLSPLKCSPTNMVGMKRDMGGAAGMLGAFRTVCLSGSCRNRVVALLCLAENSVGPLATRPDDVRPVTVWIVVVYWTCRDHVGCGGVLDMP